ncbi:hypothetical protein O988_03270 [Pseudogymnoascus sp. VKM F-3808]|nr:hypothetical protein O988_03270 [Pseudogymnoascus sp. VKM F-3808]
MASISHNYDNYQVRLDFVRTVLQERFGFKENPEVTPIQYDPECPFKYNNFVYRVSLPELIQVVGDGHQQPGCVPVPNSTKVLIFRLANPDAEGMIQTTRIENEVATITLASAALSSFVPSEHMPGAPLDESFGTMEHDKKRDILAQIAKILKALQDYELPGSITGFGGVTFDTNGHIVSTAMTSVGAGPWLTYEASFKSRLEVAFRKADANPYIKGWRANDVRERLDSFIERGLPAQFEDLDSQQDRVSIHADFTTNNIRFDATSNRITALIDYDFACISHPSYEFLRSSDGAGGQSRGRPGDEAKDAMALRDAKLHGFPSPLPPIMKDGLK